MSLLYRTCQFHPLNTAMPVFLDYAWLNMTECVCSCGFVCMCHSGGETHRKIGNVWEEKERVKKTGLIGF